MFDLVDIGFPIISLIIFLPIVGGLLVALVARAGIKVLKIYTLGLALAEILLATVAYAMILANDAGGSYNFVEGPFPWIPAFPGIDYFVGFDGLSAILIFISSFLTVLVLIGSWDLIKERQMLYYSLILIFEGSIMGVFSSLNMIIFYVFWDLVLIPMFFFIGIWGGPRRRYAAIKFFLFTFIGSVFMLLAFILIYLSATPHSFNITEVAGQIPFSLQIIASVLFFIGFGVKLPVFPFHTWLPDAHVEAPAPISVFLAGLLLKMGAYGFIRFNLGLLPEASAQYAWIFISIAIITMFYGAIVALRQTDLKRMIAMTSINHMGFVLLGAFTGGVFGISGAMFMMFNHAVAIGIMFMLSGYLHEISGTRDVTVLKGLKITSPRAATVLVLGSMAAMGLPIFSLFLSEFMVIVGAIQFDPRLAVVVGIPVITVSYFLWMMRRTVMSTPSAETPRRDISRLATFALLIFLVPLVLTLIAPWLVLGMVDPLSQALVNLMGGG